MRINLHLTFNGQCQEAFEFYSRLLDGRITLMQTYGESAMGEPVDKDRQDKIVHAGLVFKDRVLAGVDMLPGEYQKPQGFFVLLEIDELPEVERIFKALAKGGEIKMPLQETFWTKAFGVLVDRFGIPWELTYTRAGKVEGNGKRTTGNGQRETGNGERGTGNGKREMGNGKRETGDGGRETGSGKRRAGDGQRETDSASKGL